MGIENNLWGFIIEKNGNSMVQTVHVFLAEIYNFDRRGVIANILRVGTLYLITRRVRGQGSRDGLYFTDSIAFDGRTVGASY